MHFMTSLLPDQLYVLFMLLPLPHISLQIPRALLYAMQPTSPMRGVNNPPAPKAPISPGRLLPNGIPVARLERLKMVQETGLRKSKERYKEVRCESMRTAAHSHIPTPSHKNTICCQPKRP